MFLLACLGVFTVAYAVCAVLAETIFASPRERALPTLARTSAGFVFLCTYFAAAWRIMSVGAAWALGLVLIVLYWISTAPLARLSGQRARYATLAKDHWRGYLWALAGAAIFFAPLGLSGGDGPFTEGGGDVTIYADNTHYLTQSGLTTKALPGGTAGDIIDRMKEAAGLAKEPQVERDLNPPAAEFGLHRMLAVFPMSASLYAPYGAFSFLAPFENYHVYYGVQALVYALLLGCAWAIFRAWPRAIALACVALVAGSHALVSVFYNTYSAQDVAIGMSALLLVLVTAVPLFSLAGLRAYGLPTAYLLVSYPHFLSLTVPALAIAAVGRGRGAPPPAGSVTARDRGLARRALRWLVLAVLAALLALLLVSAVAQSIEFVNTLVRARFAGMHNIYMGDQIRAFSERWLVFVSGLLSQQHLAPYAAESLWTRAVMDTGAAMASVAFVVGAWIVCRLVLRREQRAALAFWIAAYGILVATVAVHIALAQTSQYTQAKGAQNALVPLYVALLLPLAMGWRVADATTRRLTRALAAALLTFLAALLILRVDYLYRLARERDRGAILGGSYFPEAKRVRSLDRDAFFLFEPRKSADVYLGVQSFFGRRVLPTRHLAIETITLVPTITKTRIMVSDLLSVRDIPHLWTLAAGRAEAGGYTWKAMRLADRPTPALLLFADDYEPDFASQPRSGRNADMGTFSYVRNGTALLYLPAGGAHSLELAFVAREGRDRAAMATRLREEIAKAGLGDSVLREDGKFVTIVRSFPESREARLVTVARDSGSYWLSARLDGKELSATQSAGPVEVPTVAGAVVRDSSGRVSLRAAWKGVRFPENEDWIGVFPLGGDDQLRLGLAYTGARKDGSVTITLPPGIYAPVYELRLFKGGTWSSMATSEPIRR